MMGAFFASLHEPIRCKVWKRENLPTTMLELLDIGISLGDAREVGCSETQNGKTYYEMSFRVNKPKFAKWKWELTKNPEGNFNGKLATPKKFVKRHKWVDTKDAIKIGLCFQCGHIARECHEGGTGNVELKSTTILAMQAEEFNTLIKNKRPILKGDKKRSKV